MALNNILTPNAYHIYTKDFTVSNSADFTGATIIGLVIPPGSIPPLNDVLISGNSAGALPINMNSNQINSLADPILSTDAANKNYVDEWDVVVQRSAYVSKGGSDITGNGGPKLPWLTIGHALAQVAIIAPTPGNSITIHVGSGTFTENITVGANIALSGENLQETILNGTMDFNDSSWNGASQNITVVSDFNILGALTVAPPLATASNIDFIHCHLSSTVTCTNFTQTVVGFKDSIIQGLYTISVGIHALFTSEAFGGINITSTNTEQTQFLSSGSNIGGTVSATWVALNMPITMFLGSSFCSVISLDGSGITCSATVDSLPTQSNITILNSAVLTYLNDAFGLGYTPTTPGDWSVVPINVQQGLDTLAANASASTVASGIYNPIASSLLGITTVSFLQATWEQIGSRVHVDFVIRLQFTAVPSGDCEFYITLPVAPAVNFVNVDQLTGSMNITADDLAPTHNPAFNDTQYAIVQSSVAGNKLAWFRVSIGALAVASTSSLYGSFGYSI